MTTLPNDDFDMCCGNRPNVKAQRQKDSTFIVTAWCGICGDKKKDTLLSNLMVTWNKWQRSKA